MKRVHVVALFAVAAIVVPSHSAYADVRAEQKTHVELAGVLGRDGQHVRRPRGPRGRDVDGDPSRAIGKRPMHDDTEQIVDLAEEKSYDLDLKKKTTR